ncbi:MAG TPA: molybdopterin-dependent oxidoreductase, partial [Desulfobacteria bacterium]|nr:molybdopterin-dependent oxidoreductase [Desulfobacteria bacterium]
MNSKESKIIKTSCRMCHGVCQVLVHMEGDKVVKVSGNPDSPTSAGYICAKAIAAPQLLYHPDRLKYPMRRKGGRGENRWQRITWEEALDEITQKLSDIKTNFGSEYFALMQGTGRPHTVFNARFANAFGTPNFSAPGHICFFPRVVASGVTMGE